MLLFRIQFVNLACWSSLRQSGAFVLQSSRKRVQYAFVRQSSHVKGTICICSPIVITSVGHLYNIWERTMLHCVHLTQSSTQCLWLWRATWARLSGCVFPWQTKTMFKYIKSFCLENGGRGQGHDLMISLSFISSSSSFFLSSSSSWRRLRRRRRSRSSRSSRWSPDHRSNPTLSISHLNKPPSPQIC